MSFSISQSNAKLQTALNAIQADVSVSKLDYNTEMDVFVANVSAGVSLQSLVSNAGALVYSRCLGVSIINQDPTNVLSVQGVSGRVVEYACFEVFEVKPELLEKLNLNNIFLSGSTAIRVLTTLKVS